MEQPCSTKEGKCSNAYPYMPQCATYNISQQIRVWTLNTKGTSPCPGRFVKDST